MNQNELPSTETRNAPDARTVISISGLVVLVVGVLKACSILLEINSHIAPPGFPLGK